MKGRNAFPRPEIAVSILAFINTSVAALKVLASSVSTRTNEKPTTKGRGWGGVRQHEVRDKSKSATFDRPNLFISRTIRTEGGERTNLLGDLLGWIGAANSRGTEPVIRT